MEEKHIVRSTPGLAMLKTKAKHIICLAFCISLFLQAMPCMGAELPGAGQPSVTFSELNADAVFLKQTQSGVCTLASSAMMVRRAAMLSGNRDWQQITEKSIRKYAWAEGTGLKWDFTVSGISVAQKTLASKNELIKLLDKHPEGIVIYDTRKPHAILATDYTDGVLYCSDPSNDRPIGRYPIEKASITAEAATRCWYVKKPVDLSVVKDNSDDSASTGGNANNGDSAGDNANSGDSAGDNANSGSINADGSDYEAGSLKYRILGAEAKTAVCIGQAKEKTSVTVPDTVKVNGEEYRVIQIAENAFANSAKLKEISIGANVGSIEPKAFYKCKKLKKVTIHAKNLRAIGADAFAKINKKAQILVLAGQLETFAALLTGTSLPGTATVGVYSGSGSGTKAS